MLPRLRIISLIALYIFVPLIKRASNCPEPKFSRTTVASLKEACEQSSIPKAKLCNEVGGIVREICDKAAKEFGLGPTKNAPGYCKRYETSLHCSLIAVHCPAQKNFVIEDTEDLSKIHVVDEDTPRSVSTFRERVLLHSWSGTR